MSVITRVIHDRKWRRANNHMDARHCPHCGATVHGRAGQQAHQEWHETDWEFFGDLKELLTELRKRTGIAEEDVEVPWKWTAVVGGQEAITDDAG